MSQLISDAYKNLNTSLHETNKLFGSKGWKRSFQVYSRFLEPYKVASCLDYGCGKGTLSDTLLVSYGFTVDNYDPCFQEFNTRPTKTYDGVICNDVLEHIEPTLLDNVLKDLYNLGSRVFNFEIALCPSNKTLDDGRNAHLIIESSAWWRERLEAIGFLIMETLETEKDSNDPKLVFYKVILGKKDTSIER